MASSIHNIETIRQFLLRKLPLLNAGGPLQRYLFCKNTEWLKVVKYFSKNPNIHVRLLREKCRNKELFHVGVFLYPAEYRKIRTGTKSVFGHFSRSGLFNPANKHLFKVNNINSRKRCKICSKLTVKTPE